MGVKYAYASISEKGTVNGAKGDQTKKEVKIRDEYNFGQTFVIIPIDDDIRTRVSKAAKKIAKNDNIGYGQSDRTSSFNLMKKEDIAWKIKNIPNIKKCNIDCSMLAGCAINFAYNKAIIPSSVYSGNIVELTVGKYPKKFKKVLYKKGMNIKAGYIIGKNGHVVVAITSGKALV